MSEAPKVASTPMYCRAVIAVTLGRTTLQASPIGLGLAALGRPAYIDLGHAEDLGGATDPDALRDRAHRVLDAALRAGVRYFDAARSYGRAEQFLGSWLRDRAIAPGEVGVGSKWGYTYTGGWRVDAEVHEVKDLSVANLRRQTVESRRFLAPWLGLYQIHSATIESGVLQDAAVIDELRRLRADGLYIGLTTTGPRQRDTILRALDLDLFDTVQATWNLLDPSAGEALAAAHEAGLGVIVKEAVANGRLTARGDVAQLAGSAAQLGTAPDALALAAVVAQPWADVVLSGASSPEMLESNLQALDLRPDAELLERLGGLAEPPKAYWDRRAGLRWN